MLCQICNKKEAIWSISNYASIITQYRYVCDDCKIIGINEIATKIHGPSVMHIGSGVTNVFRAWSAFAQSERAKAEQK